MSEVAAFMPSNVQSKPVIPASILSLETFRYRLETQGYVHFPGVLPAAWLPKLREGIDRAIEADRAQGYTYGQYAYLAQNQDQSFVDLLELSPLQDYIDDLLGDTCIIHS